MKYSLVLWNLYQKEANLVIRAYLGLDQTPMKSAVPQSIGPGSNWKGPILDTWEDFPNFLQV